MLGPTGQAPPTTSCRRAGAQAARLLLAGLVLGGLIGCTSAPSNARTPLPTSNLPGTAGHVSQIFQANTLQLLDMVQHIRAARNGLLGGTEAIPYLQAAIERLETTAQFLDGFKRVSFTPVEQRSGVGTGGSTFSATVDVSGLRFFHTALAQDNGDQVQLSITFDGFIGDQVPVADNYKAYEGFISGRGLSGEILYNLVDTRNGRTGLPEATWRWTYDADGTSTFQSSDGGLFTDANHRPRHISLTFGPDFSGTGTVVRPDQSFSNFRWP